MKFRTKIGVELVCENISVGNLWFCLQRLHVVGIHQRIFGHMVVRKEYTSSESAVVKGKKKNNFGG